MAEKKKPKPGPSTGGSSTSRIKKPKGTQPLTLGTGGLRTSKISKKQMAGTRKVVGAIAAVTPVGRAAKGASKVVKRLNNPPNRDFFLDSRTKELANKIKSVTTNKNYDKKLVKKYTKAKKRSAKNTAKGRGSWPNTTPRFPDYPPKTRNN